MNDLDIPVRKKSNSFYVYVFRLAETDYCKIGFTTHLRQRWTKLNSSFPFDILCVGYYKFDSLELATGFEKHLLSFFKPKSIKNKYTRKSTEWFLLNDADLKLLPDIGEVYPQTLTIFPCPLIEFKAL